MPGNVATGFGHVPFGTVPFGTVDWAKEHFSLIPERIKEEDRTEANNNLQKFVYSVSPEFDYVVSKLDDFTDLVDADKIPISLLKHLASNFAIEVEEVFSDDAQRAFVGNASKWMVLKGTATGYKVRGVLSGFDVEVIPLYRLGGPVDGLAAVGHQYEIPPGSGRYYTDYGPSIPYFDETSADVIPTDSYEWQFGGSPPPGVIFHDEPDCGWCRTAKLRVVISAVDVDLQPGVTLGEVLQVIVRRLVDVTPAHVEIVQIIFTTEFSVGVNVGVTLEEFGDLIYDAPVEF